MNIKLAVVGIAALLLGAMFSTQIIGVFRNRST